MLTTEIVKRAVPPNLKGVVDQAFVDEINNIATDPIFADQVRDSFVTYSSVLSDGKYKMHDYLRAIVYVTHKAHNETNHDAYFKTFPHRYAALVAKGTPTKDIAAYVSAYAKGKLVNALLEQALVPAWLLNQGVHQEAINTLARLMKNAQSEKVQVEAATAILTHLSKPKEAAQVVNFSIGESAEMAELKATMRGLATQQQQLIAQGASTKSIADANIIEVEMKDVTP